jgi:hypothetical protein
LFSSFFLLIVSEIATEVCYRIASKHRHARVIPTA